MQNLTSILGADERAILDLRMLFEEKGYRKFRMNRIESYDLYTENKNFLRSEHIITFSSPSGKLMALKPDITLSIIRSMSERDSEVRAYYNENIYRADSVNDEIKEIMQVGVEHIGTITATTECEMLCLACESLSQISEDYMLVVSDMRLISSLLEPFRFSQAQTSKILSLLAEKNTHELQNTLIGFGVNDSDAHRLSQLSNLSGRYDVVLSQLEDTFSENMTALGRIVQLRNLFCVIGQSRFADRITLDFSVLNDVNYYNGIVFIGYIDGISESVLSGGRYDGLLQKMNKTCGGIGFALYFDKLQRFLTEPTEQEDHKKLLCIALPKGRLGEKVYALFKKAGYGCPEMETDSRKLIFTNEEAGVCYFWSKPSDVSVYVERGAADIGIVGKDILEEHGSNVFELADLQLGKCRMCVCGKKGENVPRNSTIRVATKFKNIAKNYFAQQSRDIEVVPLNGSIEIAPLLDVSDVIVDIVETGTTLRENNLEPFADIMQISTRMIANKSAYRFKKKSIDQVIAQIIAAKSEETK
ncbi:MAG: ATP phosphoribosyltransferase [Clostridia bacterium]|nr:ATP phosphoribosyltransferase [Clostridia bacterium]